MLFNLKQKDRDRHVKTGSRRLALSIACAGAAFCCIAAGPAALAERATTENFDPGGAVTAPIAASPLFDHWDDARKLRYGYGMTGRAEIAARWYAKSAAEGDPRAMHNIGLMLARGEGVAQDVAAGRRWLTESFLRGVAESGLALGDMARRGVGGAPDPGRAWAYFRAAADRGESRAMHALGNMRARGLGAPASSRDAYVWYALAADLGHPQAKAAREALGAAMPPGRRAAADAEAAERAEARRRAVAAHMLP